MEAYSNYFTFLGYLLVFLCGCSAIVLSVFSKIDIKVAWNILGISILTGIFLVAGDRITEIVTPLATIKTKEKEANNIVEEMNKLKLSMEETNKGAKIQAEDIEKLRQNYELMIKDIEHDVPILNRIMLNEAKLKSKEGQITLITDLLTKKEYQNIIDTTKDEIQRDRKKLIRFKE